MAAILDAFAGKLFEKLAGLAEEKAVMILGVKDDLARLRRRLERIQPKLEAAERRRIGDKDIDAWVREMKDVMYDADDIIDLCRLEGARLLDEQPSLSATTPSLVRCNFPFFSCCTSVFFEIMGCCTSVKLRNDIGVRIQGLNDRLDEIVKDNSDFNQFKLENTSAKADVNVSLAKPRQTTSRVGSDVVGVEIEDATKDLVQSLVREDERKRCVFAVTGMGGIGKTTLAQKVFHDQTIEANFTTKAWVCISQEFNLVDKLKELIKQFGGEQLRGDETELELIDLLWSVSTNRFFLVLDDVWEANIWVDQLLNPLQSGEPGSRILITTRDDNVAKRMGANIHHVKQLSVNSGWELLCRSAYVYGEEEMSSLRDTGMQIVEKCGGLPLAIKAIAGVLTTKEQNKKEWEKVLKSHAWSITELPEGVRGALYMSYDSLPSHLKQCFLYCSLFPEDDVFHRVDLVRYWVAEGFVKTKGDSSMEDVAEEYYNELIHRNLLQPHPLVFDESRCTVHDLFRSLSIFLSRDECFYGDVQKLNVTMSTTKLRRLSIAEKGEVAAIPESVMKSLRTLLILKSPPIIENNLLGRLSFLRILILNGSGIESVPDSLGNLIHLRLLDLDRTSISSLPESLGNLANLQLLNLCGCKSLYTLPKGITRLSNLRHLDLSGTPLRFVPKGIGRLEQLNFFKGFVVGDDRNSEGSQEGSGLEEVESLSHLRRLSIYKLERAEAVVAGLVTFSNKLYLKELLLHYSVDDNRVATEEEVNRTEKLYEELRPPQCVEDLDINGFIGQRFPSWMVSASALQTCLPCLTYLGLSDCMSIQQLPPLGQLPLLKTLMIEGASAIITIGPEFLGDNSSATSSQKAAVFPKLELLKLVNMPNWEEWSFGPEFDEVIYADQEKKESQKLVLLPRLYSLVIADCPKLRAVPNGLRHSAIKELHIARAHSLRCIGNLPSLTEVLELEDNRCLEMVSHLPSLRRLNALGCPALKCVEKVNALQHIFLRDASMECLPEWFSTLVMLRQQQRWQHEDANFLFELMCNNRAFKRCLEGGADWHIIQKIPRVNASDGDRSLSYTKKPFNYMTN